MIAMLLVFWALGKLELAGSEDRWAEIVREMLIKKDFFHPTLNWVPYFDKPLFSYWFIVFFYMVTVTLNEFVVRLPSAIAGLVVLAMTVDLGKKLWDKNVGMTAGWVLLSSMGFLFWARTASADMENVAFIMLAVVWFFHNQDRPRFWSYLVFYIICFVGAQTKGLLTLVLPALVIAFFFLREQAVYQVWKKLGIRALVPFFLRDRRWRRHVNLAHLVAFFLGVFIYFLPFIISFTSGKTNVFKFDGIYMVFRENIERFFNPYDHKEPFYIYLYALPLLFLPWSLLLLNAVAGNWYLIKAKKMDRYTGWLLKAVIIIFLFFICSRSRRGYYILPLLPFCALQVAVFLVEKIKYERFNKIVLALYKWTAIVGLFVSLAVPLIWLSIRNAVSSKVPGLLLVMVPLLGIMGALPWCLKKTGTARLAALMKIPAAMAPVVVSVTVYMGGFFALIYPVTSSLCTTESFVMELKDLVGDAKCKEIVFYPDAPTKVLFYLKTAEAVTFIGYDEKGVDKLEEYSKRGFPGKFLITRRKYLPRIYKQLPELQKQAPLLEEKIYPFENKRNIRRKFIVWSIRERHEQ